MQTDKISAVLKGDSRQPMEPPDIVDKILQLSSEGWGKRPGHLQSHLIASPSALESA